MEKSDECHIKLNEKNKDGKTGFDLACQFENTSTICMMMEKLNLCNLDHSAKKNSDGTGFQLANSMIELIE